MRPSPKWKMIDDEYHREAEQSPRIQAIRDGGRADNGLTKEDEILRMAYIRRQLDSMIADLESEAEVKP